LAELLKALLACTNLGIVFRGLVLVLLDQRLHFRELLLLASSVVFQIRVVSVSAEFAAI